MIFEDAYKEVSAKEGQRILDAVNPQLDGSPFPPGMVKILKHDLPFYPGHNIVELRDAHQNPARILYAVMDEKMNATILDGTNKPVYALNKSVPLALTRDMAAMYVRFFFTFVRGAHGRFHVLESVDDIPWHEEPSPAGRRALADMIEGLRYHRGGETGHEFCASILFKDSLFESDILVKPDGQVSLTNQKILVENLPVVNQNLGH
jgi:hypothetical protein